MKNILQNKTLKTLAIVMLISLTTTSWAQGTPAIGGLYNCSGQITVDDLEYSGREVETVLNQKLTITKHVEGFSILGFENEDLVALYLGEDVSQLPCVNSQKVIDDYRVKIKCDQNRISISAKSMQTGATSKMSLQILQDAQLYFSVDIKSLYEQSRIQVKATCKLKTADQ